MNTGKRNRLVREAILFLLLFLTPGFRHCFAQTVISGTVSSAKDKQPVAGAFIYAYGGDSLYGYAFTDGEGSFSIKIADGKTADRLLVTCLGFRKEQVPIKDGQTPIRISLTEQAVSLGESSVSASVLEEKGDTLSYAAQPFTDGTERDIGELLEKIPGISVTASGGVLYNGNYINKFYVDGLDLMGSEYGVVTRNLPADRIARVEVYRNHQPVKALVGINLTDRSAVNIILKEDARNTWLVTGDAMLGLPDFPLFDARLMFSRFSKQSQDLYLAKGNDAGRDMLQELRAQQYFGKTGVFLISEGNLDGDFHSKLNPSRTVLPLPKEYWYDNMAGLGSFNHLRKTGENKQLRLSLQMAGERYSESMQNSEAINFGDGAALVINENSTLQDDRYYVSGKVSHENNFEKKYVSEELTFSGQLRNDDESVSGERNGGSQKFNLPSFKALNDLNVTFRTNDRHALTFKSLSSFVYNNHGADYRTHAFSARQEYGQKALESDNTVSTNLSVKGMKVSMSGGIRLEYQGLDATLKGTEGYDDEASADYIDISASVSAQTTFMLGKSTVYSILPVSIHAVSGNGSGATAVYPVFSPSLRIVRPFSKYLKGRADASYTVTRSGLESLLPCYVMTGYRTIARSDSLALRKTASASASMEYSNDPAMFYASINATYRSNYSDRTPSSMYNDLFTVTGFLPAVSGTRAWGGSAKISKFFGVKLLVVQFDTGWHRTDEELFLQSELNSYRTDAFDASLMMRSSPAKWISMEARCKWTNYNVSGASGSESNSLDITGSLTVQPLDPLSFTASAHYLYEGVNGTSVSATPLLKASATWKFKKFSLVAECRNLLDCKEFSRSYVDVFRSFSSTVYLPGRQLLAGLMMSF